MTVRKWSITVKLFEDQKDLIERTATSMRRGNRSVLMQAPTGSGKSIMATELVRRCNIKGKVSWFIVPRRELLRQISATFTDFGIQHSHIAAGNKYYPAMNNHVCSLDTLRRRLDNLQAPDLAIIDETHYGGAGLDAVVKWLEERGTYVIGLSATPYRMDGNGLGMWYKDMTIAPSIREYIDMERLSDYEIYQPDVPDLKGVKTQGGDFAQGQLGQSMMNDKKLTGNSVHHYKKYAYGYRCIAYCASIKHSQVVAKKFNEEGVPAAHIDGQTPDAERKRIISDFADRKILVLTNSNLLTFGFDLASQVGKEVTVEAISDLKPTKSIALQMQKWGRALRYKDFPALIFDHAGNFNRHGLPCQERQWSLEDDQKQQKASQSQQTISASQCPECYFCHSPQPVCPKCGHEYVDGGAVYDETEDELQKVNHKPDPNYRKRRIAMARTWDDLKEIEKEFGYKKSWKFIYAKAKGIDAPRR